MGYIALQQKVKANYHLKAIFVIFNFALPYVHINFGGSLQ